MKKDREQRLQVDADIPLRSYMGKSTSEDYKREHGVTQGFLKSVIPQSTKITHRFMRLPTSASQQKV
jgi:hypothetical protein